MSLPRPPIRSPPPRRPAAPPPPAGGRTIYVDSQAGDDSRSGATPAVSGKNGAKRTINAGLAVTGPGDTLAIAKGTYSEDLNVAGRKISVRLAGHVNLK